MFDLLKKLFPAAGQKPIRVRNLNSEYVSYRNILRHAAGEKLDPKTLRRKISLDRKRIYVIDFRGDVMATRAAALAEEVTAVISSARKTDEVLVRVESPGGAVHSYGYAASQLQRIKDHGLHLTVAVDKVAASGGYMMACIADKIISAPFAVVGSIGVVSEFMNFNDLLKEIGIDYKSYTAGKFKRTVSTMGPITEEAEEKFRGDLERTHEMFKTHVARYRKDLDIEAIATGEHWYGTDAHEKGLVDQIKTSEDFLIGHLHDREILHVQFVPPQSFGQGFRIALVQAAKDVFVSLLSMKTELSIGQ